MEYMLRYVVYTGLGWEEGDEGNILFTDPLCTSKCHNLDSNRGEAIREQLVQMMFETFNVSGIYAFEQAVLSLYADIGHGEIGVESRFQKQSNLCVSAIRPTLVKLSEYMPENLGMYSAWVGIAILAKVVFPQNQHVTKADYDETQIIGGSPELSMKP